MKFLGNIKTGAVIGSAAFSSKIKSEKMSLLRDGTLVELTGYQRGEDKAIMSRKAGRKYELFLPFDISFLAFRKIYLY